MKNMHNKKKIIIIASVITLLLVGILGTTFAFFSYTKLGANQQLVAGDIYMYYNDTNEFNVTDMTPRSAPKSDEHFDFTIKGKNQSLYDIIYDINVSYGNAYDDGDNDPSNDKVRIRDEFLRFRLDEKIDNGEWITKVEAGTYNDFQNGVRIYKDQIDAGTNTETTHYYRLYVWISDTIQIYSGDLTSAYGDYSVTEWENLYASFKVSTTGDFQEKEVPKSLYDVVKTGAVSDSTISNLYAKEGVGKFLRSTTASDPYPVYYYRGAVENNNVIFANKCWKIVRTTDTGGTKLIYNGEQQRIIQYNDSSIYTNVERIGNQFEFDTTTNEWKVTLTVPETGGNSGEAKIAFQIATPGTHTLRYTMPSSGPVTLNRGSTPFGSAGTNQTVTLENVTTDEIFTIAYTHYNAPGAQIEVKFAIADVTIDTGKTTCTNSGESAQLPTTSFQDTDKYKSPAYVGYNYGQVYEWTNQSKPGTYGNGVSWDGSKYALTGETGTKNDNRHYICEDTNCTSVRYYYYGNFYISLTGGDTVETALEKMLTKSSDTNKSNIRNTIESWYNANIKTTYGKYVEDTKWCMDRNVTGDNLGGWNSNGGSLSNYMYFDARKRVETASASNPPVLTCSNQNDVMTVKNGKLGSPVALLTYDEASLAGVQWNSSNSSSYLITGSWYWLLSPSGFGDFDYNGYRAYAGGVGYGNLYYRNVSGTGGGVRPSLSLKPGTLVSSGTGIASDPYVLATERTS